MSLFLRTNSTDTTLSLPPSNFKQFLLVPKQAFLSRFTERKEIWSAKIVFLNGQEYWQNRWRHQTLILDIGSTIRLHSPGQNDNVINDLQASYDNG
jgi:hypothetical protein